MDYGGWSCISWFAVPDYSGQCMEQRPDGMDDVLDAFGDDPVSHRADAPRRCSGNDCIPSHDSECKRGFAVPGLRAQTRTIVAAVSILWRTLPFLRRSVAALRRRLAQSTSLLSDRSIASVCYFTPKACHLRKATRAHTVSTAPNGHVPASHPYVADPKQDIANANVNHLDRDSRA